MNRTAPFARAVAGIAEGPRRICPESHRRRRIEMAVDGVQLIIVVSIGMLVIERTVRPSRPRRVVGVIHAGAEIRAYDPQGMEAAAAMTSNVSFADNAYACVENADALVIVTEWDAFRALDLERVRALLKTPVLVDLRNIYRPAEMRAKGFEYVSVGRP